MSLRGSGSDRSNLLGMGRCNSERISYRLRLKRASIWEKVEALKSIHRNEEIASQLALAMTYGGKYVDL
jgi:hypothetical protein